MNLIRAESRAKAAGQDRFINRLAKIANDPIVQGAGPVDVIAVRGHENCWNCVARIDETFVELGPAAATEANRGGRLLFEKPFDRGRLLTAINLKLRVSAGSR